MENEILTNQERKYITQVFSFFSASGHTGTTTLSLNTAYELGEKLKKPILWIDMDQYYNNAIVHLNNKSTTHCLGGIASFATEEIDSNTLKQMIHKHSKYLHTLSCCDSVLNEEPFLRSEQSVHIIELLKDLYSHIIIDLPSHDIDTIHQDIQHLTDHSFFITSLELNSICRTNQYIELYKSSLPLNKLKLLINRNDSKATYGVSQRDLKKQLLAPVLTEFSNDWELCTESLSLGSFLRQSNEKAELVKEIEAFSTYLIELSKSTSDTDLYSTTGL